MLFERETYKSKLIDGIFNSNNELFLELTQKPRINVPQLTAGEKAMISCKVPGNCPQSLTDIVWTGIRPNKTRQNAYGVPGQEQYFSIITFYPKSEHHNTELTCTVTLQGRILTESTVILEVRRMYHFTYTTS